MNNEVTTKEKSITFIIGNGFDLGLGLKTRYVDVYNKYIKTDSSSDSIAQFKKELKSKASNNYKKWSDFEMGMAEYAKTFPSEKEFVECIRDFKKHMVEHLIQENERFLETAKSTQNEYGIAKELQRSLECFYEGLTPNDIEKIKPVVDAPFTIYNFITFNYTLTLDTLLKFKTRFDKNNKNKPIHIHGKLGGDVVLGVDSTDQLIGTKYNITKKVARAFIKTLFNEQFDSTRVENAKRTIMDSSIICVYGFSMGESDNTWVWLLSDWLEKDKNHHLVFYKYDTPKIDPRDYDEIMDVEDELKSELLDRLQIDDTSVLDQIHIPVGKEIFNLSIESPAYSEDSIKYSDYEEQLAALVHN